MRKLIAVGLLCIAGLLTAGLVAFSANAPMVPIEELAARTNEITMFSGALLGAMAFAALGVSMLIDLNARPPAAPTAYPYVLWSGEADESTEAMFAANRQRGPPAPA